MVAVSRTILLCIVNAICGIINLPDMPCQDRGIGASGKGPIARDRYQSIFAHALVIARKRNSMDAGKKCHGMGRAVSA
jgi:hypothetical protein